MHLLNSSPKWFPYFGNQRRFVPYVIELLEGLGMDEKHTMLETNAGSHAISYHVHQRFGNVAYANDLGAYSYHIGRSLYGDDKSIDKAAYGAALMETYGYEPPIDATPDPVLVSSWVDFIIHLQEPDFQRYNVLRNDLFKLLKMSVPYDFIYCDFAWPWRDGSSTEEYTVTSDTFGAHLKDKETVDFKVANGRRILKDVIDFLDLATPNARYIILSNQSSNYPPPEVLEPHLRACGYKPIIERRLTVPAEEVDNLGKDEMFTEYQYVFEGSLL